MTKKIKFTPYNVAGIMAGKRGLSDKENSLLSELQLRAKGTFPTPSGRMVGFTKALNKELLDSLIEKRDKPFELSLMGKKVVRDRFYSKELGLRQDLQSQLQVRFGIEAEQRAMFEFQRLYPKLGSMLKNVEKAGKEYFSGYCDWKSKGKVDFSTFPDHVQIMHNDGTISKINEYQQSKVIVDMKVTSSLQPGGKYGIDTFNSKTFPKFSEQYYGQIQAYLSDDMYDAGVGCLAYVLLDAPDYIVESAQRSLEWEYGGPKEILELESSEDTFSKSILESYMSRLNQLNRNANVESVLPTSFRIKAFFFERDEEYLEELKWRIDNAARKEYEELSKRYYAAKKETENIF